MKYNKIFLILIIIFMISNCQRNEILQNEISILDKDEKGTLKISHSVNNEYLGYISLGSDDISSSELYVYKKYIVNQEFIGPFAARISVYKNIDKNYSEYINYKELYKTLEHTFLGIYDKYLFLLITDKFPTYRSLRILNLDNNEIIYEGVYIIEIGINFIQPYIIEIYEDQEIINIKVENYRNIYNFKFNKYSFNIRSREKINMNESIEIIGR